MFGVEADRLKRLSIIGGEWLVMRQRHLVGVDLILSLEAAFPKTTLRVDPIGPSAVHAFRDLRAAIPHFKFALTTP